MHLSFTKLKYRTFHIFLLLLVFSIAGNAQTDNITIKGNAVNTAGNSGLYQVVIINQRTSTGMMAEPNGHFTLKSLRTDTILVSASGFSVRKICFKDSGNKKEFTVRIVLDSMRTTLSEVKVYPTKNLREINDERSTLGHVRNTDSYQDINAIGSPIEFLYERFSRLEQSKRKVAQLENEDKRREVLKDLFHIYIRHDIINLSSEKFEHFIDYCNFPDDFIKNATDYDLVMAIKFKYEQFEKMQDYVSPFRK